MKTFKFTLLLLSGYVGMAPLIVTAATIPDGTTLMVKTTSTISSRDTAGKPFQGRLLQDVRVKGTVVLGAETPVSGIVESPRVAIASSTRPLTLKLTQVAVHGRMMPVKTHSFETEKCWDQGTPRHAVDRRRLSSSTGNNPAVPPQPAL